MVWVFIFKMMNAKQPSERVKLLNVILRRETFPQVGLGKLFWIHGLFKKNLSIFKTLMGIGPNDRHIHSFLADFEAFFWGILFFFPFFGAPFSPYL